MFSSGTGECDCLKVLEEGRTIWLPLLDPCLPYRGERVQMQGTFWASSLFHDGLEWLFGRDLLMAQSLWYIEVGLC